MIKTKKILSVLIMTVMLFTMLGTCFTVSAEETSEATDKFCFRPFVPLDKAPKFSTNVSTGVIYVCNAESWKSAGDGEKVYLNYGVKEGKADDEYYWAQKGINAFSSLKAAFAAALPNSIIKIGPGEYNEGISVSKRGIKFYGNYAGICPNGALNYKTFEMPLNKARQDETLETKITATWSWTTSGCNITIDGITLTKKGCIQPSVSEKRVTNIYFTNNILTGISSEFGVDFNRGYNDISVMKNNRVINNSSVAFIGGGAMNGVTFEDNYFQNSTGKSLWLTSTGNNGGIESLVSIKNNVFNNCAHSIEFTYQNGSFGANLDYKRIQNNIFYKSGSSAKCNINLYFLPEMSSGAAHTDTGCKTYISDNLFHSIPSGVTPISIKGADSTQGKTINYKVSIVNNQFLFQNSSGNTVINSTLVGTIDASQNFYGECSGGIGAEKPIPYSDSLFSISSTIVSFVSMPYYLNYVPFYGEGTRIQSAVVNLEPGAETDIVAGGFDADGITISNADNAIVARVKKGVEKVDISKIVTGKNIQYKVYADFLLEKELQDGKLFVTDDITRAYIVATNTETKVSTKYSVSIIAETDKTKNELKEITYTDKDTGKDLVYSAVVKNDKDITVTLDTSNVYFPFKLVVSPSASYKLYLDEELKKEYADSTFYMKPDQSTVIYAAVTSGDGKNVAKYKLTFNRTGSDDYDARIFFAQSPLENITIYNGRKRVTYRTDIMVSEVEFKFNVTPGATYTIYSDKALKKEISSSEKSKAVSIADAESEYYVKVVSKFGYEQLYVLSMYNDTKSADNLVYGVTGIPNAEIVDNVITIPASSTLSVVNAHFDTDVFADVVVYADENRTFAVEPSITYKKVNKRDVEVRTFQLGNSAKKSYFYMTVTSETGVPNNYLVILKKEGVDGATKFADVASSHWAKAYIDKASALGLVSGQQDINTGKFYFMPNQQTTRQEVAAFLCSMMGIEPYSFRNVPVSSVFEDANDIPEWSYNYVKAAYALGSMIGDAEGNFNPTAPITRQEFIVAIAGILKLDLKDASSYSLSKFSDAGKVASWALAETKAVVKAGIIEGSNGKLNPTANITRAEVATIVAKCHKLDK